MPLKDQSFNRILLIKPTALGDVVHTVPVLVKLRRRYPEAQIDWLVTPENAELVRTHPALSHVVLFDRRAFRRDRFQAMRQMLRMLRDLRRARYDLVIDLHGQARSGFFALFTGAPVRIGFARPWARGRGEGKAPPHGWAGARELAWLAYTVRISIPTLAVHAVDRYLWLGELLGFDQEPPAMALHLPPEALAVAQDLRPPGAFAVLAPGTMWETKHWRPEGFGEIARRLVEAGLEVVITGMAADRRRAEVIRQAAPSARDLCGQTSPAELAALLGHAAVCVANDSGAMHLAVAAGVPVVSVFGPTNPLQVGPYGQPENVIRAGVECSPCGLRRLAQCPNGHACMELVTADAVWERVQFLLAGRPAKWPAAAIPKLNTPL